jgi:hypothetical protein
MNHCNLTCGVCAAARYRHTDVCSTSCRPVRTSETEQSELFSLWHFHCLGYIAPSDMVIKLKVFGRKWSWPDRGTIPAFVWRDWAEIRKCSVSAADVVADIWTEHVPNTSVYDYRQSSLLCPAPPLCAILQYLTHGPRITTDPRKYFKWSASLFKAKVFY